MKTNFALLLAALVTASLHAQVLPNDAVVHGKTIDEWSAEWWKWAWTTSTNQNPFFDTTGAWAGANQPGGGVFFLAGLSTFSGTVARSFSVPETKYIFFPVLNSYCDNVDVGPPPMTIPELRQCAAAQAEATNELHASIDGVTVTNLSAHRQISPVFSFDQTNADSLQSWAAGHSVLGLIDPAVADGFYLMLEPLPPGTHVLNFGGKFGDQFQFSIDITDTVTVVRVPLPDRVEELIALLGESNLSAQRQRVLLPNLRHAEKWFERDHPRTAIAHLRLFQSKVRHDLRKDPALRDQLIQAAQAIAERASEELNR